MFLTDVLYLRRLDTKQCIFSMDVGYNAIRFLRSLCRNIEVDLSCSYAQRASARHFSAYFEECPIAISGSGLSHRCRWVPAAFMVSGPLYRMRSSHSGAQKVAI